ncbi:PUA-like domain-containing protein [Suillus lakei]|nr:PUA-like domain-containing protein [Suillus lakei]
MMKREEDSKEMFSREGEGGVGRARPALVILLSVSPSTTLLTHYLCRRHFGEYPGAPFGTTWKNRVECFEAGVHRQIEPGIHGIQEEGAFSIVVSGQYKDDKDYGDKILYTGSGGRKLDDRTREQTCDQLWSDTGNEALRKSSHTRKPVRVIRGFELDSEFSPWEGFRYDGLYICKRAWKEKNRDGYYDICRYIMERIPGQPPLRRRTSIFGLYKLPASVANSNAAQPPAPAPVTGRQRLEQQELARIQKWDTFLASSPAPVKRPTAELARKRGMRSGPPAPTMPKPKLAGSQEKDSETRAYGTSPRTKIRYRPDDDEVQICSAEEEEDQADVIPKDFEMTIVPKKNYDMSNAGCNFQCTTLRLDDPQPSPEQPTRMGTTMYRFSDWHSNANTVPTTKKRVTAKMSMQLANPSIGEL